MKKSIEWIRKNKLNYKHISFITSINEVASIMQNDSTINIKNKYISVLLSNQNTINYFNKVNFLILMVSIQVTLKN